MSKAPELPDEWNEPDKRLRKKWKEWRTRMIKGTCHRLNEKSRAAGMEWTWQRVVKESQAQSDRRKEIEAFSARHPDIKISKRRGKYERRRTVGNAWTRRIIHPGLGDEGGARDLERSLWKTE